MSNVRSAESGPVLPEGTAIVASPIIAAGASADVALPANPQFVTTALGVAPVDASLVGAPLAGIAAILAWISDPLTGVITVRISADAAGSAAGNITIFFRKAR